MTEAKIVKEGNAPHSYQVQLHTGNVVTRNRSNIYKASPRQKFEVVGSGSDSQRTDEKEQNLIELTANNTGQSIKLKETINQNLDRSSLGFDHQTGVLPKVGISRSGRIIKKPEFYRVYVS
ncbi:unnamed protein product [Ceutorhynchus assimilis]|uniref:Uncharacterized protein n=1 Tax=Ceutorhynchus assimilis TaxID=467358 RepID=A0A9N9QNG3_9CUCU|nr:unnamed protein product [Ceutorhynchus assimilis]